LKGSDFDVLPHGPEPQVNQINSVEIASDFNADCSKSPAKLQFEKAANGRLAEA
jgi:hypothetical protein